MKKIVALVFVCFLTATAAWGFDLDRDLLKQGISQYEDGDYQEAITTLKTFISKAGLPSEDLNVKLEGHFYLGLCYRATGEWDTSRRWFKTIQILLKRFGTPEDMKRWSERIKPELHIMSEMISKEEEMAAIQERNQHIMMVMFLTIFGLVVTALAVVSYVLTKLGRANRQLVIKSQQLVESKAHVKVIDENDELCRKITDYMQADKPYLNPEFSLETLTETMGVNRTYVSSAVGRLAPNFRSFVNSYRIAEAVNMLKVNPDRKFDEISSHCGFSNSRTFYNAFKSYTGLTPSEYRRSLNLIG